MSVQVKSAIKGKPPGPERHPFRSHVARFQLSTQGQFLGTVAVSFILLFLRRPDSLLNAQFWAEDSVQFFGNQVLYGFWESAITPYAGYLHLAPRLIMAAASPLPTLWTPFFCNLAGLLIAAICCSLFVLPSYRYILDSDLQRFVVILLAVSAPYCDEISGNITNIQWYLAVGAALVVFRKCHPSAPPGTLNAVLIGLAGVVISCSSPLGLVFLPFLIWKLIRYDSTERIWLGLMTSGVVVQSTVILGQHAASGVGQGLNQILAATLISFVYRVLLCTVAGFRGAVWVWQHGLSAIVLLMLVLATWWLTGLYRASAPSDRRTILTCLYLAFSSIGMSMVARSGTAAHFSSLSIEEWRGERYFYLSACLLILLAAVSIKAFWPTARPWVPAIMLCGAFFCGFFANFRIPAFADLHWSAQAPQIDAWRNTWAAGRPVRGLEIRVNPQPQFLLELPSRLAPARGDSPWEGCLVQDRERSEAYFVEGGRKHHVVDSKSLAPFGLRWPQDLVYISKDNLARIPLGEPIVR
jgi:hypothetical protein